ncbi:arsenate reductase (glutaredoxin) [Sulfurimonas aquatica]|uniref:Arsenate reductase (Glutaredoxin) n=1 Tax=Sulfurimonas aquatica TaxID=2672570 RepID=A0A975GBX4_9BACT|nr:arsenate reductase (glutaredoxin) [Sulfurimonas aquatica]QSZ40688.1 arsenate reductase (glutaredoxin) [Sulfurimonas aquatica]
MSKVTIWHNPRCTKSREGVAIAQESSNDVEVVKYLDSLPTKDELKEALKMLGMSARELMRTTEAVYKELDLKNVQDEEALIDAMLENPKLIQRPVIFKDGKAIIGRPSSAITEFLNA